MIKTVVRKFWQFLPRLVRSRIVRVTQQKFTASAAAIITNRDGEILLLEHVLRPASAWGLPGGFIGRGENIAEAIRREIREEVGMKLDDLELFRVRTVDRHIEVLFTARSDGTAEIRSREITGLGWFAPDSLPHDLSRVQKTLIAEVLSSKFDKP